MNQANTEKKGKGYIGKSMSVNAQIAYDYDEMPKSKWTKKAILQYLDENDRLDLVEKARNLPLYVLREYLENTGYHHTGAFYKTTRFYIFNIKWFDEATEAHFESIINANKAKNPKKTKEERDEIKRKEEIRKEMKAEKIEREKLFKYSSYKTLKGFLRNVTPELEQKLAEKRQEAIQTRREQLRETWTKQGFEHGLLRINDDDFIDGYISF